MNTLNTYRVDVTNRMSVPVGMASIRHIGTQLDEATRVFDSYRVGVRLPQDAWGADSIYAGVLLCKWNDDKQEYVIVATRWSH